MIRRGKCIRIPVITITLSLTSPAAITPPHIHHFLKQTLDLDQMTTQICLKIRLKM